MSEELDVGSEQPQAPQLSATEQKAMEQGWRPKEEFSGDPEAFIDAAEFVRRGELFTKIEHQSKELKQVRQALDALKEHHSKVKETEYKNALKALDNARKQALTDGETDRFFALEERIEEVKAEKQAFDQDLAVASPREEPINQEFTAWTKQNSWYESNKAMRAYADKIGIELHQEGHDPKQVLKLVEQEVKKEFAHKFQNQKSLRPMAVEPAGRSGGKADSFSLSTEERDIMRKFVRSGVMTEAEYISELKKVKGS